MKLLILAGGFGTRLQSVVADVPKALAPVGRLPFLYYQIEHWIDQGLKSFVFLLHHKSELIISFLESEKNGLLSGCQVDWLVEPTPMDTGGAVAYAVKQLNLTGSFFLTNADTWLESGVREIALSTAPSMVVLSVSDTSRYGEVKFNDKFCVTVFDEKTCGQRPGWINAGTYHLNTDCFKDWDGRPFSLERFFLPELVSRGALKVVQLQTNFIDIGIPADYHRFCRWVSTGRHNSLCN